MSVSSGAVASYVTHTDKGRALRAGAREEIFCHLDTATQKLTTVHTVVSNELKDPVFVSKPVYQNIVRKIDDTGLAILDLRTALSSNESKDVGAEFDRVIECIDEMAKSVKESYPTETQNLLRGLFTGILTCVGVGMLIAIMCVIHPPLALALPLLAQVIFANLVNGTVSLYSLFSDNNIRDINESIDTLSTLANDWRSQRQDSPPDYEATRSTIENLRRPTSLGFEPVYFP